MPPRPNIPISSLRSLFYSRTPLLRGVTPVRRTSSSSSTSSTTSSPQKPELSNFKRPIAKCFLGAMFTYQVLYWGWLQLETDEIRAEKGAELATLEDEARRLTSTS